MKITTVTSLNGELNVPGDKSISHRAIMISSLANGKSTVRNFLMGDDCLSTINCFKDLGIDIDIKDDVVYINGKGLHGLTKPQKTLDVGNSGTTMRLLSGILAGQSFDTTITGDDSIQKRPMKRIIDPLSKMGANITSIKNNNCAPLHIKGNKLNNIKYNSPIASAQVKSSIILASLYTDESTTITEPYLSRNHTEIMLEQYGGKLDCEGNTITTKPTADLQANEIIVPGDISSAAFFITAGLIVPDSNILIKNCGINPTRSGIIDVYKKMGGHIELINKRTVNGELVADIIVKSSELHGTTIDGSLIPRLIDEIPVIAVAASLANGKTIVKDASELKVKESNRIDAMVNALSKMGAKIVATEDGMEITGVSKLCAASIDSCHDHRVAMSIAIAGLVAKGTTTITNSECVAISYPNFEKDLETLRIH